MTCQSAIRFSQKWQSHDAQPSVCRESRQDFAVVGASVECEKSAWPNKTLFAALKALN